MEKFLKMIEKLICIVLIALLWLYTFQTICGVVEDTKYIMNRYNIKIEQGVNYENFGYD